MSYLSYKKFHILNFRKVSVILHHIMWYNRCMKPTDTDIAWAAGLFEGEGCLSFQKNPSAKGGYTPRLWLNITDEDVIKRFQSVVGTGVYSVQHKKDRKPIYKWRTARKSEVLRIMDMFEPYMGSRRTAKFQEVRAFWKRTH